MKKDNKVLVNKVKNAAPVLAGFDDAVLCGAVANLNHEVIIKISKAAEKTKGNYEGLTVNNSKTKRSALIGIVGRNLADRVFEAPAAVGPIYNMVHYIQSNVFGSGISAAEEKAERRANSELLASTARPGHGRRRRRNVVIEDEFDLACVTMGFDPDNLSPWEEEEAMRMAGWIN